MPHWLELPIAIGLSVGIPLVVVGPIIRGALRNRRLRRHGGTAKATVVSVQQTSTQINDQPVCDIVLRIEPEGEEPFEATSRQVVALTTLVELTRGAVVTVRYDPRDRRKVVLEGIGFVATSRAEAEAMIVSSQRLIDELNKPGAGVAATALVREFSPTGVEVNGGNPLARMLIKVLPPGGEPFDATVIGVFGKAGLHKYQPGKEIAVRFDPADRTRVTMDVSRTLVAQSNG